MAKVDVSYKNRTLVIHVRGESDYRFVSVLTYRYDVAVAYMETRCLAFHLDEEVNFKEFVKELKDDYIGFEEYTIREGHLVYLQEGSLADSIFNTKKNSLDELYFGVEDDDFDEDEFDKIFGEDDD